MSKSPWYKLYSALGLLLSLFLCSSASSDQSFSAQSISPTANMTAATIKMLASLALILGIIIFVFYLLRRFKGLSKIAQGGPRLRVATSIAIAPKRSVTVIEIEGKWLVLGVGTESINLLYAFDSRTSTTDQNSTSCGPTSSFQRILNKRKRDGEVRAPRGDKSS